jgi:hypothetical protein
LDGAANHLRARGIRETLELLEMLVDVDRVVTALSRSSNQEGAFSWSLDLYQLANLVSLTDPGR